MGSGEVMELRTVVLAKLSCLRTCSPAFLLLGLLKNLCNGNHRLSSEDVSVLGRKGGW